LESPSSEAVRGYNGDDNAPGAQTERRGDAGPVRALLVGETSPAAFVSSRPLLACSSGPILACVLHYKLNSPFQSGGFRMTGAVKTEHPHIIRLDGVCGGEPVIDGLRVTVRHVATLHRRGETILEIAEALGITEAQVFHALSYFFDHRDEILALIAQEEQAHARCSRS
jgi:uncharacterized protein (DUF433 family)